MQSASDTPSSHLWEWCEAGIELAMMWRSATDAGRTGAQRLSPSAVILGHGRPKMYHEHGDTPVHGKRARQGQGGPGRHRQAPRPCAALVKLDREEVWKVEA